MRTLLRLDRRLGAAIRHGAGRLPGAPALAGRLAGGMSPAFRVTVGALMLHPATRPAGVRALAAGAGASLAARVLRDRLGRRRPGARADGGLPSRHAAAAVAIARAVARRDRRIGVLLGGAACAGLVARVVVAEHDPADIAAGAALGAVTAAVLERLVPERLG